MRPEVVEKSAFQPTLRSRCEELCRHAQSGTGPQEEAEVSLRACFRSAADLAGEGESKPTAGRAQFDLWWMNCPSAGMPVLLWDRWEVHDLSRADYEALLTAADGSGLPLVDVDDDAEWLGEEPPLRPLATWKYHPERFKGVMPFAGRIEQIGRQCKGNPDTNTMNELVSAWQDAEAEDFTSRPLRARVRSSSRNSRRMFRFTDMLMFHAVFAANARQIFDIPPQLGEMFRRTDVDDITAESIKVPYPGIYLHFGPQSDLAFDPDWTPEGAYVYELRGDGDGDRVLQFCIAFAPKDLEKYRDFDVNFEPVYVQALAQQHMRMPLGDAVDLVLSEKMAQLRKEADAATMPGLEDEEVQELAASQGITLVSAQATRAKQELDSLEPQHKCYLEMLKLIVNSLAYLAAYPKDVETRWPANTPRSLLKQLAKTDNRNEQRRVQSKLAAMGFSPVHLCGRRLAEEIDRSTAAAGATGQRAVHWRRGHWRRQPHGPQNSLRKLAWLMPTLVNPGGSAEEPLGHLYLVT